MTKPRAHLSLILLVSSLIILVESIPTQLYNDPVFLDAEIARIRAGKAGVSAPVIKGRRDQADHLDTLVVAAPGDSIAETEEEDDEDSNYSDEVEVTCATGKGWHYRGQRCVPYHCPGGSSERDFNTGQCLHSFQPNGRHKPYSQWNSLK